MAKVKFTSNLLRFFPSLTSQSFKAESIKELIEALESRFPGLASYLIEEKGNLRAHVNIFIGSELIKDRAGLSDVIRPEDEVYIMQAISGG